MGTQLSKTGKRFEASFAALHTIDLGEVKEADVQWQTEYVQYEKGPLHAAVRLYQSSSLQIIESTFDRGVMVRGGIPQGALVFALASAPEQRYQGTEVTSNETVLIRDRDEIEYWSRGRTSLVTVAFDARAIEPMIETRGGRASELLFDAGRVVVSGGHRSSRLLAELTAFLGKIETTHVARSTYARAETYLREGFLSCLAVHPGPPTERTPARRGLARRAEAYIRENFAQSITTTALCHELGASERTLNLGFRERYGLSPHAYLTTVRMDAARKALLSADRQARVTDIAMQVGICHLGRFSVEYRSRFGESPSQTLSRNR